MGLIASVAISAVIVSATGQSSPRVVDRVFQGPGNERVEGVGVCEIDAQEAKCWNMDGQLDKDLSDYFMAYALTNNNDIAFRFRKKNRWLAVRRPQDAHNVQFSKINGEHIGRQFSTDSSRLHFLQVAAEPAASTATLLLSISRPGPRPFDIPFGGTTKASGMEFRIGKPSLVDPATPGRMYPFHMGEGKVWAVPVEMFVDPPSGSSYQFAPLDSGRRPIAYVDAKGKPVPATTVMEENRNMALGSGNPMRIGKYQQAMFYGNVQENGVGGYQTNVDPAFIKFLQVGSTLTESVEVKGFPLDPS